MDKWQSGDFLIQIWCIPLEAFASGTDILYAYLETKSSHRLPKPLPKHKKKQRAITKQL